MLPPCRWRLDLLPNGRYHCASSKLISLLGVDEATCQRCPYVDHEPPADAGQADQPTAGQVPSEPPGLLRRAANFAGALGRAVAAGLPLVTQEQQAARLEVCKGCQEYSGLQCRQCGCVASLKAMLGTEDCPLKKWPKIE